MKQDSDFSLAKSPLYNSRIIKTYIQYVRKKYPHVNISDSLAEAGITLYEADDQGHWFSLDQVDRFYEQLVIATGNKHLARDAGRYASLPETIGAIRYYVHSFSSPARFYEMIGGTFAGFTRTVSFKSSQIASNKVEIIVKPK
ncbi:MAG: hypothetical protein ACLFNW_12610 [Desulfobacterales bacterium]